MMGSLPEPAANGSGRISNHQQETQTEEGKRQAQEEHLECYLIAAFIHKLRQKSQKEDGDFRVEDI